MRRKTLDLNEIAATNPAVAELGKALDEDAAKTVEAETPARAAFVATGKMVCML